MTPNPRTNEPIDKVPSKDKERPKITPEKRKGFKGTPTDVQNVSLATSSYG